MVKIWTDGWEDGWMGGQINGWMPKDSSVDVELFKECN